MSKINCDAIPLPADCFCQDPKKYTLDPEKYGLSKYDIPRYQRYCDLSSVNNFGKDKYCQLQQPESLDYNCYCKYPNAYKNSKFGLTRSQIEKMDAYCANVETVAENKENPKPPSIKQKTFQDFGKIGEKAGELITGMLTPKGISTILEIEGVKWITEESLEFFKTLVNQAVKDMTASIESDSNIFADLMVREIGNVLEDTIIEGITTAATDVAVVGITELTVLATTALAAAASVVGLVIDVALAIIGPLMMAGMLLDMWDPYGFNNMLSADILKNITDKYNNVFTQLMFNQINLPEGNTWPVEYLAEYQLLPSFKFSRDTENSLKTLSIVYSTQYLESLVLNSRGEFIYRGSKLLSGSDDIKNFVKSSRFKEGTNYVKKSIVNTFSNNNLVLSKWIKNNWLPIVVVIVVIVVILFTIKV